MSGLRILQLVNTLAISDGGPSRNSFELNLALNAAGTNAALVAFRESGEESVVAEHAKSGKSLPPVPPRALALRQRAGSMSPLKLLQLMKLSDVIIIHGMFMAWVPLAMLLACVLRKATCVMPHGSLTPHDLAKGSKKKNLFVSALMPILRNRRTAIVTGSEIERDDIAALYPSLDVRWAGVGTAGNDEAVNDRAYAEPLQLLTMSRIAPKKRIDLAIDAVSLLIKSGRQVHLVIAGTGDPELQRALSRRVATLGLIDNVTFLGPVRGDGKAAALRVADVFILPSEDENFGIAAAEAAASGLRVVASRNVAAAAMIPEGARLIDRLTADDVAQAVETILNSDPVPRSRISEAARAVFSWTSVSSRWLAIAHEKSGR